MPLRIRFRFDAKCSLHPRYDPAPGLFTITLSDGYTNAGSLLDGSISLH